MQQADVGGITIEYEVAGTGVPIVFIHGSFIADTFLPIIRETALERFTRVAYRRRGYLGSSRPALPLSISEQAADCAALLRFLGMDSVHVVAHSFGGAVALQLALQRIATVRTLVLLEPALMVGSTAQSYRESLVGAIRQFREAEPAIVVHDFFEARWPGYRASLEKLLPGSFVQAVADSKTAVEIELPGLLGWTFTEIEASHILEPVLSVLGGDSDALWPRFGETHRWLLSSLPDAEGYVLPGTTHFLQVENPQDLAEALAAFYARHGFL